MHLSKHFLKALHVLTQKRILIISTADFIIKKIHLHFLFQDFARASQRDITPTQAALTVTSSVMLGDLVM